MSPPDTGPSPHPWEGSVLVRHARPVITADVSPDLWALSGEGVSAAARLAPVLARAGVTRVVASTEAKAVRTARIIAEVLGLEVSADPRLGEVSRPWVGRDFDGRVRRYLEGADFAGWEPRETVTARMLAALGDASGDGVVALVSHGTAIALLVEALGLAAPAPFWSDLRLPDAWRMDASRVERLDGA